MAIQFKRGSGHSSTTVLAAGQPYYDYTNNLLYIGASNGTTSIANTTAVKASMISPSTVTSFVSGGIYVITIEWGSGDGYGTVLLHYQSGAYTSTTYLNDKAVYGHATSTTSLTLYPTSMELYWAARRIA